MSGSVINASNRDFPVLLRALATSYEDIRSDRELREDETLLFVNYLQMVKHMSTTLLDRMIADGVVRVKTCE